MLTGIQKLALCLCDTHGSNRILTVRRLIKQRVRKGGLHRLQTGLAVALRAFCRRHFWCEYNNDDHWVRSQLLIFLSTPPPHREPFKAAKFTASIASVVETFKNTCVMPAKMVLIPTTHRFVHSLCCSPKLWWRSLMSPIRCSKGERDGIYLESTVASHGPNSIQYTRWLNLISKMSVRVHIHPGQGSQRNGHFTVNAFPDKCLLWVWAFKECLHFVSVRHWLGAYICADVQ